MARLPKEDRVGIYITVIVHLTVIIIFLLYQIGRQIGKESTFVLDFTKQEEIEKEQKEVEFKEDISRRLDELLGNAPSYKASDVKNVAVNRAALKDDRNTDADQLYKDAERLANELKNGQNQKIDDAREETVDLNPTTSTKDEKTREYSGASVLSYNLDGRKMTRVKIPAYKCYGSGDVTVIITVNPQGTVIAAKVSEDLSSQDKCLRENAIRAARNTKFTDVSGKTTSNQLGDITYRFIAQ